MVQEDTHCRLETLPNSPNKPPYRTTFQPIAVAALLWAGLFAPQAQATKDTGCGVDNYCRALVMGHVLGNADSPMNAKEARAHCKKNFLDPAMEQTCYGYYNAIRLLAGAEIDGSAKLNVEQALDKTKKEAGIVDCNDISTEGESRWAHAICTGYVQNKMKNCGAVGIPERADGVHLLSRTFCRCMQLSSQHLTTIEIQKLMVSTAKTTLKGKPDAGEAAESCLSWDKYHQLKLEQDTDYTCFKGQVETAPLKEATLKPVQEAVEKVQGKGDENTPPQTQKKQPPALPPRPKKAESDTFPNGEKIPPPPKRMAPKRPSKKTDSQEWRDLEKMTDDLKKQADQL